jgi:hypothetical protein
MTDECPAFSPGRIDSGTSGHVPAESVRLPSPAEPRTFHRVVVLGVLLLILTAFHVYFQPKEPLHTTDSLFYLAGAKSLAEGNGYRMVLYEGAPNIGLYPPLQSFYLSLFWRVNGQFPENVPLLNGAMLLLLLTFVTVLYFALLRFGFPLWGAVTVPLCFAIQPGAFWSILGCFSDLLFAVLSSVLALIWLGSRRSQTHLRWALTGLVLALLFLTRTAAAAVVLGAVLVSFVHTVRTKAWRPFLYCAGPACLAVIFWISFPKETADYSTYFKLADLKSGETGFLNYAFSCGRRVIDYSSTHLIGSLGLGLPELAAAIIPGSATWETVSSGTIGLFAAAAMGVCIIGYARHSSGKVRAIGGILLLYCAQLIFWPFDIGARGIIPLLPFICFGFHHGLAFLPQTYRRPLQLAITFSLLLGILPSAFLVSSYVTKWANEKRPREIMDVSVWAKQHIPEGSHVATSEDWFQSDFPMMHFVEVSGHQIVPTRGGNLESYLAGTDYVVYEGFPRNRDSIYFREAGRQGHVVYRTPHNMFQIVKVTRTNATDVSSSDFAKTSFAGEK